MLLSERTRNQRGKWEILKTKSLAEVVHKATDLGWAENKVQVRGYQTGIENSGEAIMEYVIEPFEKDCGCSNILKYNDYARVEETLLSYSN